MTSILTSASRSLPTRLPLLTESTEPTTSTTDVADILSDLQSVGLSWPAKPGLSRKGGAGPSDHKAVEFRGHTVMVPIFSERARNSIYEVRQVGGAHRLLRRGSDLGLIGFPRAPRFYALSTKDGIPYFKLATLHAQRVLATTVLQNCTRYGDQETSCQFCAIGRSLSAKTTIARKTPEQLAEVAKAAVELDGVEQMVMTTGTPKTSDRGAALLAEAARAVSDAVPIALQAQCEPPDDPAWFERLKRAGVSTLGMHLESVTESVRRRIMPGKAEVTLERYYEAFERAVAVFGRGEVTTYILAGLGDTHQAILGAAQRLSRMGVYPFVVPFVPIAGTPLAEHPPPDVAFMKRLLDDVANVLRDNDLSSQHASAGCGKCGACSTLRARESRAPAQRPELADAATQRRLARQAESCPPAAPEASHA